MCRNNQEKTRTRATTTTATMMKAKRTTRTPLIPWSPLLNALFIRQPDPKLYHEPGTPSRAQKGKTPVSRKRGTSSTNIWASFGLTTDQGSTLATNAPPAAKKTPTAVCGLGTRGTTRRTTRGHVECAQHLVSKDFTHWKITYFDHPDRQDWCYQGKRSWQTKKTCKGSS